MIVAQAREPADEIDERGHVGRRRAAEAVDEAASLAGRDQLLGVDVGERRDAEGGVADQLGEDAAGAERDQRAEDGILDEAGQQLGAASGSSAGRSPGAPIFATAARTASASPTLERDAIAFGLMHAGGGGLDDDGVAERGAASIASSAECATTSPTSGIPYASKRARASAGLEPGVVSIGQHSVDDRRGCWRGRRPARERSRAGDAASPPARRLDRGRARPTRGRRRLRQPRRRARSASGMPSALMTTARTGLSPPPARATAAATSSAVALTAGTNRTITASTPGSSSTSGSAASYEAQSLSRACRPGSRGSPRPAGAPRVAYGSLQRAAGSVRPAASQASAHMIPSPPALVSTATPRPASAGCVDEQRRDVDELLERAGADDSGLVEERVDGRLGAGQGRCVRAGRASAGSPSSRS